jgi:hypothetical protein
MTPPISDICRLAQNLARNCGYSVFPCREDKTPATPDGFKSAQTIPDAVDRIWQAHPGPLVGIRTGEASGISVLDVDQKHPEAVIWWQDNYHRLLPTRTFATRSGGLHLYFRHRDGIKNTSSKLAKGIDTRGEGGYVISWWCAGLECHDHSPPEPWPCWLFDELTRQPPAPPPRSTEIPPEHAIAGIVRRVEDAQEGERNAVTYWAACRLAERGLRQAEAEALLLPASIVAGLPEFEARRSIQSAYRGRAAA